MHSSLTITFPPAITCPDNLGTVEGGMLSYSTGTVTVSNEQRYPVGTIVSVICNSGLRKVGNTLTCLPNGVWNSTLPTCEGEWNGTRIHLNDYTNYMSRTSHSFFTWHHVVYYIM